MARGHGRWLTGILLAAVVIGGACGGDDEPSPAPDATPVTPQPSGPAQPDLPATATPAPPAAPAVDPSLLAYGESARAEITDAAEEQQFRFEGTEGDLVRISADGKDGMDPVLILLEPNRVEIASSDDVSSANRDALLIARLPSSGLQVVRVAAYDQTGVGAFVLSVDRLPDDPDDDDRVLALGDSNAGRIGAPDDVDFIEFAGNAGQRVLISVDGDIGTDLFAQLLGPDGGVFFADDDSGHGLDAEIDVVLPATGAYRVEISASPVTTRAQIGPYRLRVQEFTGPQAPAEEDAARMIGVGRAYLQALQDGDSITLFALAGPEALALRGWESREDVSRDLDKLQGTGIFGEAGDATATVDGARGRVQIRLTVIGKAEPDIVRFDLINVNSTWLVDFFDRFSAPEAAASPGG